MVRNEWHADDLKCLQEVTFDYCSLQEIRKWRKGSWLILQYAPISFPHMFTYGFDFDISVSQKFHFLMGSPCAQFNFFCA